MFGSHSGTRRILAETLDQLNTSATRPVALELLNGSGAKAVGQGLGLPTGLGIIVIGYEDNAASVRWQLDKLKSELARNDFAVLEGADAEPLWNALTEFQAASAGRSVSLPIFARHRLRRSSKDSTHIVGRRRHTPAMGSSAPTHRANGRSRAWHKKSKSTGGSPPATAASLILSCCPTEWKERLRVWGEPRGDWSVAERVKAALDPHGAMNPGRFVGGI